MTNLEWIRTADKKELAEFLDRLVDAPCAFCPYYDDDFDCVNLAPNSCVEGRLAWLKQEHKSNSF